MKLEKPLFQYMLLKGGSWLHESPIRLRCANHSIIEIKYHSPASGIRVLKSIKLGSNYV